MNTLLDIPNIDHLSDDHLMTLEEYAAYVRKSANSIRNDLSRNSKHCPKPFKLPGGRRQYFRAGDVKKFIQDAHKIGMEKAAEREKNALPKVRKHRGDSNGD
jgi:hypothetical protein